MLDRRTAPYAALVLRIALGIMFIALANLLFNRKPEQAYA